MGTEPDSAKEQVPSSHFDAGGEIQGVVEGEEPMGGRDFFDPQYRQGKRRKSNIWQEQKNGKKWFLVFTR